MNSKRILFLLLVKRIVCASFSTSPSTAEEGGRNISIIFAMRSDVKYSYLAAAIYLISAQYKTTWRTTTQKITTMVEIIFSSTGEGGGLLGTGRVTHARIDKSISDIECLAFRDKWHLLTVETHDGIRKIGGFAFYRCLVLRRINLKSAVEIESGAFCMCEKLETVEFGDNLETIGIGAFYQCNSLKHLKLPSIITIGRDAFSTCKRLTDIEFSERLETIGTVAFRECYDLQRIAIPLKRDLFEFSGPNQKYTQFVYCEQLTTVDIVGQAHTQTIASLHMESWRAEMSAEINRINQVLPTTPANEKTNEIKQWIDSVIDKMDHYRSEHARNVREGTTLLVLALWKAKLDEKEESPEEGKTRKVKVVDSESARKERRITCGADIVIKNVLPFLQFE